MTSMDQEKGHIVEPAVLARVWGALVCLTIGLVSASLASPKLAVLAMLVITPAKAWLVFHYFMHLKYEGPLLKGMVLVALLTLVIFISMMFLDLGFR
ncbi:MAG: cytochrome C oxidase subunit IV family protein [Elusimicrobia bacterium]|nr:cytochrome C oxidase subunit IV family protein [Elusimicrobiota bacterium]